MRRVLMLVALLAVASVAGWGYTINLLNVANGVWNTGWTSAGVYGTNDAEDGHYTWTRWTDSTRTSVHSYGTAFIINDSDFPMTAWRPNIENTAAWVSTEDGPPNINSEAWYSYYTTFTLPNTYSFWNVNMAVDVWADNQPQFIGLYSGTSLLASATPATTNNLGHTSTYDSSTSSNGLPITANLLAPGTYTIRFDVYNAPGGIGNPTGLFVLFHSATAEGVPEPATYALMGTVGLALYLLRRRKAAANK